MKKKHIVALLLAVLILGVQSCAQEMCPAYAKKDTPKEKTEKKEGRF